MTTAAEHPVKPPPENQVQPFVMAFFRSGGWKMGNTSQYRTSGQLVGLPDLVMRHTVIRRFAWWETKAPMARWRGAGNLWVHYSPLDRKTWRSKERTPAQVEFGDDAILCGQLYGWGGIVEAEQFSIDLGMGDRLASGIFQWNWPKIHDLARRVAAGAL